MKKVTAKPQTKRNTKKTVENDFQFIMTLSSTHALYTRSGRDVSNGEDQDRKILRSNDKQQDFCIGIMDEDDVRCQYVPNMIKLSVTDYRAWTTLTAEEKVEFFKRVQNDDEVCRDISRKMKIIPNFTTWKWNPDITEFEKSEYHLKQSDLLDSTVHFYTFVVKLVEYNRAVFPKKTSTGKVIVDAHRLPGDIMKGDPKIMRFLWSRVVENDYKSQIKK